MLLAIPTTPLLRGVAHVLRAHQLHADLHRAAAPIYHPTRNVDAVPTNTLVLALIGIAISASLLAFAALRAGRDRRPPNGLLKPWRAQYRAARPGTDRHPTPGPPAIITAALVGANLLWA